MQRVPWVSCMQIEEIERASYVEEHPQEQLAGGIPDICMRMREEPYRRDVLTLECKSK